MSSFTTPLRVEYLDGRRWRVLEPFRYCVGAEDSWDAIEVHVGFETDFASIPRLFWSVYPPAGQWGKAAVVHDFLYRTASRPRAICDRVFLEAMGVLGVPWLRRHAMYAAVRLFGGLRAYDPGRTRWWPRAACVLFRGGHSFIGPRFSNRCWLCGYDKGGWAL